MKNISIYKINGKERKQLKKELSLLKQFIHNFHSCHLMDKDMCETLGCSKENLMSDDDAQKMYKKSIEKMKELENILGEKI